MCISGFMTLPKFSKSVGFKWVIGDIFLSLVYAEYDIGMNRIGFAHKKEP